MKKNFAIAIIICLAFALIMLLSDMTPTHRFEIQYNTHTKLYRIMEYRPVNFFDEASWQVGPFHKSKEEAERALKDIMVRRKEEAAEKRSWTTKDTINK